MSTQGFLLKKFEAAYGKLNEAQREAVDAIEGPVMVIAGPGTGKTQILASRIGKILLETDAQPQNILCLTFTDAGVVAMRERLIRFIGSDAYKVHLHTFHSFCHHVIQDNLRHFNKRELQPLTDLERIQVLKELIDQFPKGHPLKRYKGDVYYDLDHLANLFSAIKREGWEISWVQSQIDRYVTNFIPTTDGFYNKREQKKGNYQLTVKGKAEIQRMEKLSAATACFPAYQSLLEQKHRYDFDDMIHWVIRLFETESEILLGYQEQFQYILVDEYQDTSGSQNRIVELLASYWSDQPNLFVVGDDDQSIYRFQGANLMNLMTLARRYEKDLRRVVLTKNYRSVQPILDAAKGLIENNKHRLIHQFEGLSKELIADLDELKELNIQPELRIYESELAEQAHIARSIRELIEQGTNPGEIAVIYREHKLGDELMKFLQQEEVPFYVKRSIDLLQDPFLNQVLNLLRYLAAEQDNPYSGEHYLFEIMHSPYFGIRPFTIANLCYELAELRNKKKAEKSIRGRLNELIDQNGQSLFNGDEQTDKLLRFGRFLEAAQTKLYEENLHRWFEFLLNESGLLPWVMSQSDRNWQLRKLSCLFDYLKESTQRKPEIRLGEWIEQIRLMKENGIRLSLVQTTGKESGVNLMTCHGSKGLEFEHVFLLGARNDIWEGKRDNNRGFRLPPTVFQEETDTEAVEELRRLFFVSITRAKKHLYVSYPKLKHNGNLLEPSQFYEELKTILSSTPQEIRLSEEMESRFASLRFGLIQRPVIDPSEQDWVDQQLSQFVMNVTALNNYLDCPLKFYYSTLIRVPSAKSEVAEFGTAVHKALNDFIDYMTSHNKQYPEADYLVQQFRYHLYAGRDIFTQESLKRFLEHGESILRAYYNNYYQPAPIDNFILTETPLRGVVVNGIPLKGFTDKIQFWGNDIIITDFKTGKHSKAKSRGEFDRPGGKHQPLGGNYWRQAVFYKLLVDNSPGKNWNVLEACFDFVEPNDNDAFDRERIEIRAEDVEYVTQQLSEAWQKIQNREFNTGCGKEDCEWCNFTKEHKLYAALEEDEGPTFAKASAGER
ncbi:MAG: ATP-dependent helicase [Bacteroidetes bacterium]|nr:ATP-dependent helicase [Bacteroidota bacterium]